MDVYNIRYHYNSIMILEKYIVFKSTNDMIREINIIQKEKKNKRIKLLRKDSLIDIRVRVNIPRLLKITATIKRY